AEGVRPAAHPRRPANPRLHQGGAPAQRLGLPGDGLDAHARLARLPPAAEAEPGGGPVRGQRVGRGLPAGRRTGGGGVSAALAAAGWLLAAGALALALATRRELAARMERLARAAHELRRPLTAARLAAH